jgi:hypothetical protein
MLLQTHSAVDRNTGSATACCFKTCHNIAAKQIHPAFITEKHPD